MLIAIAIAEEIQGLQRIALKFWASEFSLTLARSLNCIGLSWSWSRTPQRFTPAQTSTTQTFCQSQRKLRISKLCNSWISSAMAMAMSIYRTLCVLVFSCTGLKSSGMIALPRGKIGCPAPQNADLAPHHVNWQNSRGAAGQNWVQIALILLSITPKNYASEEEK